MKPCALAWGQPTFVFNFDVCLPSHRFNSYTQTLCINDVVQKPNGIKASETDLQVKLPPENTNSLTGPTNTSNESKVLSGTPRSRIVVSSDGQREVSQTVTWTAKFVDKISEVTDSMNISGKLRSPPK